MWIQIRERLEKILKSPETYDNFITRFYGVTDDKPTHDTFVKLCMSKFDKGRLEHQDTWHDFCDIIDRELQQEYLDVCIYEILRSLKN